MVSSSSVKQSKDLHFRNMSTICSLSRSSKFGYFFFFFFFFFCPAFTTLYEFEPPHTGGSEITHKDAPQSVGLLWTSDQPVAETST
jgi:hypothetical protein